MNLLQKGITLLSVPLLVEIGLILVLLNQIAGKLGVDDNQPNGSTFWFSIPIV